MTTSRCQSSLATLFQTVFTVIALITIIIRIMSHKPSLGWLLRTLLSVSHLPSGMLGLQVGVLLKPGLSPELRLSGFCG